MLQTGPGVRSVVVPDGSVAVAAPGRRGHPPQALVGAAAGGRAPYGTHTVPVGCWRATGAAAAAAAAVSTVTDPT